MSRWWIALPVWGERYLDVWERSALPALKLALLKLDRPTTLIIHTDQSERVAAAVEGLEREIHGVPGPDNAFESLSNAHRFTLAQAAQGDRICLLTADLVVSSDMLASCEAQFRGGKELVCCAGMRACDDELPPNTESGHELLAWGWEHRHPMTRECTWPDGKSYDVWRMYFEKGSEVVCRLSLPHPIALVKPHRNPTIRFSPTVDVNVANNFSPGKTHLITEPSEGAMIELSPHDKEFIYTKPMVERLEHQLPSCPAFVKFVNPRHRGFFGRRIIIKGKGGDCGDERVVNRLIRGE
jgi:hypothetical protein